MKIGTKTFYQRAVQHAAELIVHRLDEALDWNRWPEQRR